MKFAALTFRHPVGLKKCTTFYLQTTYQLLLNGLAEQKLKEKCPPENQLGLPGMLRPVALHQRRGGPTLIHNISVFRRRVLV